MNENKKGRQTVFLPRLIHSCHWLHTYIYLHFPYRQTEGIFKASGKRLPDHPSYSHIYKRINRLSVDIKKEYDRADSDDDEIIIIVAADSTGIKVTNRGQLMSDK